MLYDTLINLFDVILGDIVLADGLVLYWIEHPIVSLFFWFVLIVSALFLVLMPFAFIYRMFRR